ncbi:hypothetical protein [Brevibacterium album]|uniref:hypothetical protein n=1 Tax=Brevibacterium album TaxID=417948 RepID=UPI0012EB22EF|nr:hypothetical protein [Brevibacterium album]
MPKPYPKEFRDDVINVARNRDSHTTLAQVAKDFGLHDHPQMAAPSRSRCRQSHRPDPGTEHG